jgi:hypothetical protein
MGFEAGPRCPFVEPYFEGFTGFHFLEREFCPHPGHRADFSEEVQGFIGLHFRSIFQI